ncbi:MAG TPA: hypothetical protein VFB12_03345 [Ktedonobacteraceae bacterium]|nr:hypothetical protein [Ktedonobacteraceae bacterium]
MFTANISRKVSMRPRFVLPPFFCLILLILSACTSQSTSSVPTPTAAKGDALYIPVSKKPEIIVKSENAAQITVVGSDIVQTISTDRMSLPYKKEGNKVTIDFGETVIEHVEIKIPRQASLSVTLKEGNIAVDTIQGQVSITLNNGPIRLMNFTPLGTNTITTKNGTINTTFDKASCNLKAQTDVGAIVSGYSTIKEKRSGMKDEASGIIGTGSAATVNLVARYGSITLGPA